MQVKVQYLNSKSVSINAEDILLTSPSPEFFYWTVVLNYKNGKKTTMHVNAELVASVAVSSGGDETVQ